MKKTISIITAFVFFISCSDSKEIVQDIPKATGFTADIQRIYNFYPHTLSKEGKQPYIARLDSFWDIIKADTTKYLSLIRTELKKADNPTYFYWDGCGILMTFGNATGDKDLALEAMSKSDVIDVDPYLFLFTAHEFATHDKDVSEVAMKLLDHPKFQAFLPEHVYLIEQADCLTFLLLNLEPSLYESALIKKFGEGISTESKKSILTVLYYTATCNSDAFISSIAKSNSQDAEVTELAKMLQGKINIENRKQDNERYTKSRKLIKQSMSQITDEAMYELTSAVKDIRKYYTCQ